MSNTILGMVNKESTEGNIYDDATSYGEWRCFYSTLNHCQCPMMMKPYNIEFRNEVFHAYCSWTIIFYIRPKSMLNANTIHCRKKHHFYGMK